jgi:hypothetical protein
MYIFPTNNDTYCVGQSLHVYLHQAQLVQTHYLQLEIRYHMNQTRMALWSSLDTFTILTMYYTWL